MSTPVPPKTRSRVITGWRQATATVTRGPKWKKPVPPPPRDKAVTTETEAVEAGD